MNSKQPTTFATYHVVDTPEHWGCLLQAAFSEGGVDLWSPEGARQSLKFWAINANFRAWAQSLPPEEAAKLFAILHE